MYRQYIEHEINYKAGEMHADTYVSVHVILMRTWQSWLPHNSQGKSMKHLIIGGNHIQAIWYDYQNCHFDFPQTYPHYENSHYPSVV